MKPKPDVAVCDCKASAGAAAALRGALKDLGKLIDDGLENQAHAALAAAGGDARGPAFFRRRRMVAAGQKMIVVELFLAFSLLSFVAFGGATALLPEMHRVVVDNHHWLDDTTFTHL